MVALIGALAATLAMSLQLAQALPMSQAPEVRALKVYQRANATMEIPPAASASVAYKVEVAVTPDSESSTIKEDLEIRYPVANFAYKIEVATLDSATDPAPGTPAL